MAIGHMVPAAAPQRDAALAFARLLASAEGRALLLSDVAATGLYTPIFVAADDETIPATVRQGMALVQGAERLTAPYYMSVPPVWAHVDEDAAPATHRAGQRPGL